MIDLSLSKAGAASWLAMIPQLASISFWVKGDLNMNCNHLVIQSLSFIGIGGTSAFLVEAFL